MESGKEKEDIIELTEVVEEKPSLSGKREFKERRLRRIERRRMKTGVLSRRTIRFLVLMMLPSGP